jgi:hypothetical protein
MAKKSSKQKKSRQQRSNEKATSSNWTKWLKRTVNILLPVLCLIFPATPAVEIKSSVSITINIDTTVGGFN